VGIDDVGRPERASAYLRSALRGASPEVPSILLCHRPYFLPQAAEEGIDLVLSGHTHGGQIVFGRFGNVTLTPASSFPLTSGDTTATVQRKCSSPAASARSGSPCDQLPARDRCDHTFAQQSVAAAWLILFSLFQ